MVESIPKRGSQNNPNPNKPVDVHSVVNAIGESVSSISIWNIVNELGKIDFSCGSVVNNLKENNWIRTSSLAVMVIFFRKCHSKST